MATYKEIQQYVKNKFGYMPKSCWIAHAKEVYGLSPKVAHNRKETSKRKHPCPAEKLGDLEKAFEHFRILKKLN